MRLIDWGSALSADDKAWALASGILGMEDRIAANEQQFAGVVEEGDYDDDYDDWKVAELEAEVAEREPAVELTGTGKDGKVLKLDLIAGLRAWDRANPAT